MQYLVEGTNTIEPMDCCFLGVKCSPQQCNKACAHACVDGNCGCKSNFCGGQICTPVKAKPPTIFSKKI